MKAPQVVLATGKRKEAIARATIRKGRGLVHINDRPLELVEPDLVRFKIQEPLLMVGDRWKTVDISVDIQGGGVMGQASAARTAIARGLLLWLKDPALDDMFKHYDR